MRRFNEYMSINQIIYSLNYHGFLCWMSDKANVSLIYRLKVGKKLDLKNPRTFNEKLQWLKIYDQNPMYKDFVDKITAKKIVATTIGGNYVVPMYAYWESPQDIDLSGLPEQLVLKCNHDQGSVILVADKNKFDKKDAYAFLRKHLKRNNYYTTREYGYKNIKPLVFAEKYLGDSIKDYKFYCFNGVPKFLYVGQGLTYDHSLKIDYFDMDWNHMPFYRTDYNRLGNAPRPKYFDEMKEIAVLLSKGIPFVRIDLFEENDQVYFSEFSLCPASGFMPFEPAEYDRIIGDWLEIKKYDKKTGLYINSEE